MGKTKNKGGLGVLHMKTQNQALLLKYLENNYNKKDVQWGCGVTSFGPLTTRTLSSIHPTLVAHFGGRQ